MLKFATWKDLTYEMLKVMSLLTLAHIVEEEDNDKLIDETGRARQILCVGEEKVEVGGGDYWTENSFCFKNVDYLLSNVQLRFFH